MRRSPARWVRECLRTRAHGRRRLMAMALCRVVPVARRTSSRTVARRRRRKKSSRCSTSLSTGSKTLAGDPDASAVTTWQAALHAGGAARLLMASKSFTRRPFLEHFVDVPVLQITDEVDAAVKGSGEVAGVGDGRWRRWRRSGCGCAPDAAPWHCRLYADQALKTVARCFGGSAVGRRLPALG